jgi:hypothetical protein
MTDAHDDAIERRLRDYFLNRALELLEEAKGAEEAELKYELEERVAGYWRIARGHDR